MSSLMLIASAWLALNGVIVAFAMVAAHHRDASGRATVKKMLREAEIYANRPTLRS